MGNQNISINIMNEVLVNVEWAAVQSDKAVCPSGNQVGKQVKEKFQNRGPLVLPKNMVNHPYLSLRNVKFS